MNYNLLSNLKFIILKSFLIVLILITGIQAQDLRSNNSLHKKMNDTYQFPKLPMIPGRMSPEVYTVIKQDFTITLRDNVILDCSKFYPSVQPILANGYPGVIMCHGYGDDKTTLESMASSQASNGYSVYTFSMRGQGISGGLSNLISRTEAQDLIEVVNYVKHDYSTSSVDSSNVLIMGGSQGAIIPYMAAACFGMQVKTIIAALASPTFATSWIENGCIKRTLFGSITYPVNQVRYEPVLSSMVNWIYADSPEKWDSIAYWLPINRDFAPQVSQNHIPIMLENCWQDYFFNTYENIATIPNLTSPKRYYFGAVQGHGGDYSLTENTWHENFFNEWFFYWLFNINNGILTRPIFHYASTSFPLYLGMWSFVHDSSSVWSPGGLTDLKLYFNPNKQLKTTPNTRNNIVTLKNSVDSIMNMHDALDDAFSSYFYAHFTKDSLIFTSPVLANKTRMTGTPSIKLDYASSMNRAQFNFQVYEVQGSTQKMVTRVNFTDRYNSSTLYQRKIVTITGNSHSHIFQKGDKIRIIITNIDQSPFDTAFLGTNPFVLPVLDNGKSKIFLSSNCYVTLPLQVTTMNPGKNIFVDENPESILTENTPVTFNLNQNYPNPFNPSTTIDYSVPHNSFVSLKVYDISGKEVAVLINSQASAGNYSINFNADSYHLSSGIYFYKLVSGNQTQIRKMMLIK